MKKMLLLSTLLIVIIGCKPQSPVVNPNNNVNIDLTPNIEVQIYNPSLNSSTTWAAHANATITDGHLKFDIIGTDPQSLSLYIYDCKAAIYNFGGKQNFTPISFNTAIYKTDSKADPYTDDNESLAHDTFRITMIDTVQNTVSGRFIINPEKGSDHVKITCTYTNIKYTGQVPSVKPSFICNVNNVNRLSDSVLSAANDLNGYIYIFSAAKDGSKFYLSVPVNTDVGTFNITESGNYTSTYITSLSPPNPNEEFDGVSGTVSITLHTLSYIQGTYTTTVAALIDPTQKKNISGSFTAFF